MYVLNFLPIKDSTTSDCQIFMSRFVKYLYVLYSTYGTVFSKRSKYAVLFKKLQVPIDKNTFTNTNKHIGAKTAVLGCLSRRSLLIYNIRPKTGHSQDLQDKVLQQNVRRRYEILHKRRKQRRQFW